MRLIPRPRLARIIAVAFAAGSVLAACGGGETPSAAVPGASGDSTADGATVTIERSRFEPAGVVISTGGSVEFVNLDAFAHTVTAADASPLSFDSGSFGQDDTFSQRFDDAGRYDYFCAIHPTIRATVTVE